MNHNTETVPRLYRMARSGGRYTRTLELLDRSRRYAPGPEILEYPKECVEEFGLESHLRLGVEATRAVAQIGHDHLVDVYDFVADPQRGVVSFIMEYLAGEDLRKALEERIDARAGDEAEIEAA